LVGEPRIKRIPRKIKHTGFLATMTVNVNADISVVAEGDNNIAVANGFANGASNGVSNGISNGVGNGVGNGFANGAAHVNRRRLVVVGLGMVALGFMCVIT
jgi:hypothetical protein